MPVYLRLAVLITLAITGNTNSQVVSLPYEDRIRISEAFKIGETYGNEIWEGWSDVPFAVLLVTNNYEFLIRHPNHSNDFKLLGYDSLLQSEIYFRKKVFDVKLLASFPAVNAISTVVVGQPENTGKPSCEWIITLLHEHFHQLQSYQPDYYSGVNALNLSGGDETGMWMLNYPFPYDNEEVNDEYKNLTQALLKLLKPFPPDSRLFSRDFNSFLEERMKFKNLLKDNDYKYFSFQLWQEGVARYTEYKIADLISHYEPSNELTAIKDYKPFYKIANDIRENIFSQLEECQLKDGKRLCFYSYGAAEALLLDQVNKDWKEKYFREKFSLESYFNE
jgi:hypothetical protein